MTHPDAKSPHSVFPVPDTRLCAGDTPGLDRTEPDAGGGAILFMPPGGGGRKPPAPPDVRFLPVRDEYSPSFF